MQRMERHAVEKAVDRAEGTKILAKGSPYDQAREHRCSEDKAFPRKQPPELGADQTVMHGQQDPCERPGGTDILAEKRRELDK